MNMGDLKTKYKNLLQPIFGEQLCIDDGEENRNWVVILLDGKQKEFFSPCTELIISTLETSPVATGIFGE